MTIEALHRSVNEIEMVMKALEADGHYINKNPFGEVKLDKHGLYPDMNSPLTRRLSSNDRLDNRTHLHRILMILNYSDGEHRLSDIADLCGCDLIKLVPIIELLKDKGILEGPINEEEISRL